jgi:hypothetical protein
MAEELDARLLQALIERPSESLNVEHKTWLDLSNLSHQAKLIRAVLALRNFGGGYLVLGIDDQTGRPSVEGRPSQVRVAYGVDLVQSLISRYASQLFEVQIHYALLDGEEFPVIVVPPGIRTPVACRSRLVGTDQKPLLELGDVYVRTLTSNHTPSSSKAGWRDWEALLDVCFENREADIGRFIRRHLAGVEVLSALLPLLSTGASRPQRNESHDLLSYGLARLQAATKSRGVKVPPLGSWEVAAVLSPCEAGLVASSEFLDRLAAANPDLTGWPIWLDSRSFPREKHPYVFEDGWEALIASSPTDAFGHFDFMRLDPHGRFYLYRGLQDDTSRSDRAPVPGTELDFGLAVLRTAEAIAVSLAFGKALCGGNQPFEVDMSFRWAGLSGRSLTGWAQPRRQLSSNRIAQQDSIESRVTVGSDVATSSIAPLVESVVSPLFRLFEGFVLSKSVIEDLVAQLVERRLF